jgi:soluble lytic murein transglycosylase-like protein
VAKLPESQVDLLALLAGLKHGVNPVLVKAIAYHETGWNPSLVGGAGELGIMQVLPDTAATVGFTGPPAKLQDAWTGMDVGTAYLATRLKKYPNTAQAVSAYNAGRPITGNAATYTNPVLTALQQFAARWQPLLIVAPFLLAGALAFYLLRRKRSRAAA